MQKTTQLRNMINSKHLELLMEAHHALSAKIVEEAGFKGIWASGLSMSAALGVRDNNEASWTQVLEVLEFMSDATSIPILLDGDTGYGNFNNARRLVKKLELRKIAGVCIEDKLFPKTNSFIKGEAQPLADIDEFCHKIKAMKDIQTDDDFVVISRVEAFIAGWGLKEALRRAEAYRQAGSDAILIHSKKSDITEIEAFMKEWGGRHPVVVVPTKFYQVPTGKFRELGISMAIWANHNLRTSISAMQKTTKQIFNDESLINVEKHIAPVEEVFRLQGAGELAEDEKKYLPSVHLNTNSIILVRQTGDQQLLSEQIDLLNFSGIKNVSVIGGANAEPDQNGSSSVGKEVYSLHQAKHKIEGNTVISFSEMIYRKHVLEDLINDPNDITIIVDGDVEKGKGKAFISASTPYSKLLYSKTVKLIDISSSLDDEAIHGEFIGLWKVSDKGAIQLRDALDQVSKRSDFMKLTLLDLFNHLREHHPISVKYIKGQWLDLNSYREIQQAGDVT